MSTGVETRIDAWSKNLDVRVSSFKLRVSIEASSPSNVTVALKRNACLPCLPAGGRQGLHNRSPELRIRRILILRG
jgi:hypothetical protein